MGRDSTLLGLFDGYMSLAHDGLSSETKLGGSPVYLPAFSEAQAKMLHDNTTCGVCGHRMYLLLQAFSPLPSASSHSASTWNRMLYVFCCNSSSCARQPSSSWSAISVLVDREDTAAENDAEDEEEEEEERGTSPLRQSELPPYTFPPCYVYVDAEPPRETIVPTTIEREMAKLADANAKVDGNEILEEDLKELEKYVDLNDKKSDYYYEKFRARVARAPSQVLRYHERAPPGTAGATGDRDERPLFMNPDKVKRHLSVPACPHCGAVMVHELQVMPTALFYLRANQYVRGAPSSAPAAAAAGKPSPSPALGGNEGVDFGTATVYVCSKDCAFQCHQREKQEQQGSAQPSGSEGFAYVRREAIRVEEPPSVQDDRQEAASAEEGGRVTMRGMMEDVEATVTREQTA